MTPRIEVSDLVVRYGDTTAVDGVSFAIAPGELVTLLGPSGCGKTTTLRAIAGLETPSAGGISLNGSPVWTTKRAIPAEKRGVSMVFQSYAIWPHMTVFENVAYGLRVRGTSAADIKSNVARVLDMVQMGAYADRPSSALSGGQQQRVAVRAPSPSPQPSCCSMSRCPTSTPNFARKCASNCGSCSDGWISPRFT